MVVPAASRKQRHKNKPENEAGIAPGNKIFKKKMRELFRRTAAKTMGKIKI